MLSLRLLLTTRLGSARHSDGVPVAGRKVTERFVRWQSNTIAQLSAALSLFSGLSIAALGFLFSLLRDPEFVPRGAYATVFLVALFGFFLSTVAGVAAVITRLLDFRLTAKKVRDSAGEEVLTFFGTDASGYGRATWRLFWVLVVAFAVGVLGAVVVLSRVYLGTVVNSIAG
jgi:hypothetical protein